jgi:CubicO group peptidase (beta-lactamase class C family)
MSPLPLYSLAAIEALVAEHRLPGLLLAVSRGVAEPASHAIGCDAAGCTLTMDSLFPVASVTKLATALAVLRLAAGGHLELDDPLAAHLPAAAAAVAGVTLRTLLCHTSGLPNDLAPELAPYAHGLDWAQLGRACLATPLVRPPHSRVTYSNVNFGLLALVVEQCTRLPFATALTGLVLDPLQIEGYFGVEPPQPPARVAGNLGEHAGTDREPFNSPFWRSLALPWAGLVTNAGGALALVRAWAGQPAGFLPRALCAAAVSDQTGGLSGGFTGYMEWQPCPWGLGAELLGAKSPHMVTPQASPASFGHSGYSGCLAWCDPRAADGEGVAFAILGGPRYAKAWQTFWQPASAILLRG